MFKKAKRPVKEVAFEMEKDALIQSMKKMSGMIKMLRGQAGTIDSEYTDMIIINLDAAERTYFALFNRYRVIHGFKPCKGDRFNGAHNYESYLFRVM
jgi:hypothetical protein